MNNQPYTYLSIFVFIMLLITPAAAADRQLKPHSTYMTQAMIESSNGNQLSISRLGTFTVKSVSAAGFPKAKCNINTQSLKDALHTGFRQGKWALAKGVVITVELKMRIANGEVFCYGGGTGCKAEVVVDRVFENAPL